MIAIGEQTHILRWSAYLSIFRYYFEMLAEELYYDKQFSEAKTLIDNFYKMFPGTNHELKLLSALISR